MNTQNVKTAAPESTERCGKTIRRIIDKAHSYVACAEEVHAHYGDKFTRLDVWYYFIRGALAELSQALKASE
ncbi:hypothetical protein [Serratia proteamaculans]|uniref:hypothetical protein n=1 Tax=Serratia proteamaculans TaxID=28151 RepID=UPI003D059A7F